MKSINTYLLFLISFLAVDIVNILASRNLNQFGLIPRQVEHLTGILFAPWLHGNLQHLSANLAALVILASVTWQWGSKIFWQTSLFIILLSGLLVWLTARPAIHIGASGLVYGYFGFCVLAGWFSKKFYHLLISVLITIVYGSMVWGVLPLQPGMSFEYHLAGVISGILAARLFAK